MQLTIGSNTIDVRLGVVGPNGHGGRPGPNGVVPDVNEQWLTDPSGQVRRNLAAIEEASGRKDGWVNRIGLDMPPEEGLRRWAWKWAGVNVAAGKSAAPYLMRHMLVPGSMVDELERCDSWYIGSTWSGDNSEEPRGICSPHQAEMARIVRVITQWRRPPQRVCFDQAAVVIDGGENEAAFMRVCAALAARGIEVLVEALPKDPRDLAWIGGLARYAHLVDRKVMLTDEDGFGHYVVARGARLVIAFDGKVKREEKDEITTSHVQRVVEWAAAYGVPGHGAAELELLLVGPQHAKPVVEWATEHKVL